MTDKTGFSVGMSVNPSVGFKKLPDRIALDLCKAYPLAENLLLRNTRNDKRTVVTPSLYASLLHCSQFKTIDEHVAFIIENNPDMKGQQADVQKVLKSMLDSGIMVSAKDTCDRLKQKVEVAAEKPEAADPVVAIITWERPKALERLLESIAKNCETRKLHRLYVIDDSRKAENITQNQALVETFASKMNTPLIYFGQDEQRSLLDKLISRLPEHKDAIYFLADQSRWQDQWTAGLSRNLALLVSSGHRLVMMDDDSICDVYNPPNPKPGISYSDGPREAAFYGSQENWESQHQPLNPDPIDRHMKCLGLPFSQALESLGENHLKPAGFSKATALEVSELLPDSPVLTTECGSVGCPGTARNTWLPDTAESSLKQMLASGEKTTNALTSRKVWIGRNQPHFSPRPNMSQITGFDNRQMLPPYLPIMRGQDRLFGIMLDFIFPNAVSLDYAWAIPHLPIPERGWRDKDLDFTPADSFPVFFFEKVLEYKSICQSVSAMDRLSALSAWFNDMASSSDHALTNMYRDARLQVNSERLQKLGSLLSTAESAPVDWQNYLRNGVSQLNIDLDRVSRDDFLVRGLPADLESDDLIIYWKDIWSGFAEALSAWPEIHAAASEILKAEALSELSG